MRPTIKTRIERRESKIIQTVRKRQGGSSLISGKIIRHYKNVNYKEEIIRKKSNSEVRLFSMTTGKIIHQRLCLKLKLLDLTEMERKQTKSVSR